MNDQDISTSSLGSEDSQLPLSGLDIPPESSANRTTSVAKSSSDTGPMSQSSETSETLTAASGAEPDCSQADFLVSLSVKPGSDEARRMTVTSGLKCSELLKKLDPISCLQRMLLASSTWHSTMCFLNWKAKGTPQGRLYFQLAPSTPRTEGIECGLLPTPTAVMIASKRGKEERYRKGHGGANLAEHVAMCPTPTANESKGRRKLETLKKSGRGATNSLGDCMNVRNGYHGSLNPQWVEWLMGYPLGHTDLKPSETPSSRK